MKKVSAAAAPMSHDSGASGAHEQAKTRAFPPLSVASSRIVVAIAPEHGATELIRFGMRLAEQRAANWIAVCVRTPEMLRAATDAMDRLARAFRLAEELGGETAAIDGDSTAAALAAFARVRGATQIVVGVRSRPFLRRLLRRDLATRLLAMAGVQVIAVQLAERLRPAPGTRTVIPEETDRRVAASRYAGALVISALCTALAWPITPYFDAVNVAMLYLLGTTFAGLRLGRGPSAVCAIANVAAFDFFFVPPLYTFYVAEPQYLFTLGVMLVVTLVISNLMVSVRRQTESAAARERRTSILYAMTRELVVAADAATIGAAGARHVGAALDGKAVVLLAGKESGEGELLVIAPAEHGEVELDRGLARRVMREGRPATTDPRQNAGAMTLYLPLSARENRNGVLAVTLPETRRLLPDQMQLLEALAGQIALALERARLIELATASRAAAERAALRNTLLASISHDLRGPLSAIAGAGSLVAQSSSTLDSHRRAVLGHLIEEKALDMTELLTNVLELVRLETATAPLRTDWQSLEDLVSAAIRNTQRTLDRRRVKNKVPADFPPLQVDGQLIVQLLSNLLDNAAKYTPPETSVEISAIAAGSKAWITVEDDGPGFGQRDPASLFEKFERGQVESAVSGFGLGLTICRAIVDLHGGDIEASNRPEGGARFEIRLPLEAVRKGPRPDALE
jgi:two-component system, OmpR family, sensor histidine kinase KdpD